MSLRTTLSLLAAASLTALPVSIMAAPVAEAQSQCSWNWGIKQSYRNYIKGQVAKGTWKADGIGFTGSETGADGAFTFSPTKTVVDGNMVTVGFNGVLHFTGHNYGGPDLLDMTISDWKVQAEGNRAAIVVDYVSYESDMVDKTKRGDQITGDDAVIAEIALDKPVDASAATVDLAGNVSLTSKGHDLFLAYDSGEVMDPSSGSIATDGSCDSGSGSNSNSNSGSGGSKKSIMGITGDFTGYNKEAMDILKETNDTMNGMTAFMNNTEIFLDQLDSFRNRTGGKAGTSGSNSGTSGASGTSGGSKSTSTSATANSNSGSGSGTTSGSRTGSGNTGGATSGASGRSAASGGNSAGASGGTSGGDKKCEAATGVVSTNAAWGVKKSFQSYITGSIAKGSWTLNGVDYSNERFQFSGNSGNVDVASGSGSLNYGGSIQFTGHNGVLDLNISNLEIQFSKGGGKLVADVRSSTMEGERIDFGRTAIGDLSFSTLDVTDNSVSGEATVRLTESGNEAFAQFYEPGIELDPLSFSAELGGEGDCSATGGSSASGSATGAGGSGAKSAAAAKLAAKNGSADGSESGSTTGYKDGSGNFKIKSASAASGKDGFSGDAWTWLMLLIAGLVVAGGSVGRVAMHNPA